MAIMETSTCPGARLRIGALLVALLSGPSTVNAADAPRAECHALNLEHVWLQSTAQAGDGSLLAVNPLQLSVLKISPEGQVTGAFTGLRIGKRTYPFNPSRIQRLEDGTFLLANAAEEIAHVHPMPATRLLPKSGAQDLEFRVSSSTLPVHAPPEGTRQLAGMYDWNGTSDGHVLAFADAIRADGTFTSGFVWFDRWDPSSFEILYEVEPDSQETKFYFVMHPYVTAVHSHAYFLSMGDPPTIYEYTQGEEEARKLSAFPEDVRVRPELPEQTGVSALPGVYEAFADEVTPLGIYPWAGSDDIGLLARSPARGGGTNYTLTRIDPEEDEVLYTLHLPAETARHVTLAPGDRQWLMLLKSEVEALGNQDVTAILSLPAQWFEGKDSPLLKRGMRVECR